MRSRISAARQRACLISSPLRCRVAVVVFAPAKEAAEKASGHALEGRAAAARQQRLLCFTSAPRDARGPRGRPQSYAGNSSSASSAAVLLLAHLFQPLDILAVLRFLNRDMRHRRRGRCSVPMLQSRWEPNDIARPHLLDGTSLALHAAKARQDDQRLSERVRVPRGACSRLKCNASGSDAGALGCRNERINSHRPREILCLTPAGRLRAVAPNLHGYTPFMR